MTKPAPQVLAVGNCGFDHRALSGVFDQHFAAQVRPASTAREALAQLRSGTYDLVLVNRQFDADGDSGLELIRQMKEDPQLRDTPVMLISNYPQYQQQAVDVGALPGFGKSALQARETLDRVRSVLSPEP